MTAVTELGYAALGVKNLNQWLDYAGEVLGLEVVDEGDAHRRYLRMDFWHHRFILDEDGSDDLNALGFRVAGSDEFEIIKNRLTEAGVRHRVYSRAEAEERHVLELLKLEDPNGNPLEIFHGPHVQYSKPFHPGRRMYGKFATGTAGLGHCIVHMKDLPATYRFYTTLLGMRGGIEYKIPTPDGKVLDLLFMHCNDRDHTIAFGLESGKRINHIMIEAQSFDDLAFTYDIVRKKKIPIGVSLGKHSNDHQYSFYFFNPSGWMFEYGWGSRPASHQTEYYTEDIYGHEFQPNVLGASWDVVNVSDAAE